MTEKPNSVCRWCQKPIEVCLGESPDSTGQCKGYVHVAPRTHFCPGHVAEPAEPSHNERLCDGFCGVKECSTRIASQAEFYESLRPLGDHE